ncbi:MAG: DUF2752 domain-containing protein [Tepidisphaeraceae bacterium]
MHRAALRDIPIIYTPPVQKQTIGLGARVLALAIALAALSVLIVAVVLSPAPAGVATHRAMGFAPCEFLERSNLPCPTCGMTTSFAHFVRGNWLASVYVQPMGFIVAVACGGLVWAGLYVTLTASPLHRLLQQLPALYTVPAIMAFAIAAWAWKIFIHLRGVDGWG